MISFSYFLEKVKDVKVRDLFASFPMFIACVGSPFFKKRNQDTWLICEEPAEARDNGYWFFKKMRENHPEQRCVYAIDKKSVDYQNVYDLGEVIQYGGVRHWLYYFTSAHTISSQKGGKPNAALCAFLELNGLFNSHTVFLQHGITINDPEWLHADRSRFDMLVTSALPEHEFIKEHLGYSADTVQLCGFPRFDNLHDFEVKPNRIVVMPTWRSWFNLKSEERKGLESKFQDSCYLREWRAFLESERLAQLIDNYGLEVVFYPHRNMQKYLQDIGQDLNTKVIIASWREWNIQELLKSSEMMITDYSSVFFDMIYMKKPVLFYQFDLDDFRRGQYKQGWYDYAHNPFASSHSTLDGLLDDLESIIKDGYAVSDEFLVAHENCFPYTDTKNSERIYGKIKELEEGSDPVREKSDDAFVGIVIVNYNTTNELFMCLDSIEEQTKCPYRIYVVENGSKPEVRDVVTARCADYENLELIVLPENRGYSGGNNVGVLRAIEDGASYIAIVNSDIVFVNDILSIMSKDIQGHTAVVGPQVVRLDGTDGQQIIRTYSYSSALVDRQPFYSLKKAVKKLSRRKYDADIRYEFDGMVSGCCFLIDAAVFEEIGLFDENVFLYSEERIISIKLKELGYKVRYEPLAAVIHMEGKTTGSIGNPFADFHRYASDYYAVTRYCRASKAQMEFFKALRLGAFRVKKTINNNYSYYYDLLRTKLDEIDAGVFKIESTL